jgi:hypothetical protein
VEAGLALRPGVVGNSQIAMKLFLIFCSFDEAVSNCQIPIAYLKPSSLDLRYRIGL